MHEFLFSDADNDKVARRRSVESIHASAAGTVPAAGVSGTSDASPAIVPLRWQALAGIESDWLPRAKLAYSVGQLAETAELLGRAANDPRISLIAGARCLFQAAACRVDSGDAPDGSRLIDSALRRLSSLTALSDSEVCMRPNEWLVLACCAAARGDADAALTWSLRAHRSLQAQTEQCDSTRDDFTAHTAVLSGDVFAVYGATMLLTGNEQAAVDALSTAIQIHTGLRDPEAAAVDLRTIAAAEVRRGDPAGAMKSLTAAMTIIRPVVGLSTHPRAAYIGQALRADVERLRQTCHGPSPLSKTERENRRNRASWN